MSDGTVYIEAEGKEDDLKKFFDWCHEGPRSSKVNKVESEYSDDLKVFKDFVVKY